MNKPKIIFTERAIPRILEAFGKKTNEDGIIIESATGEPVETPDGEVIHISEFGGMKRGSEIYLKDDLRTIMSLAEGKY